MNMQAAWIDPVRTREALVRKSQELAADQQLADNLNHAVHEAHALAWTTPYPSLVLPVLLEEKLAAARSYSERQKTVRLASLELLRRLGDLS